jgi:hypothetical protein
MTVLSVNDVPLRVRPLATALSHALWFLSKPLSAIAKSWMDWSKFEYELFRARSHDENRRP